MRSAWYVAGVDSALHGAGLPYGYTVALWSTGALLIASHDPPGTAHVFLFAAGAALGYGALKLAAREAPEAPSRQLSATPHLLRAGAIHVATIAVAIGAADLITLISSGVAWGLASFAATVVYLLGTGLELGFQHKSDRPG